MRHRSADVLRGALHVAVERDAGNVEEVVGAMDEGKLIFEMRGISKSFGATRALHDVQLPIRSHEVHAIMGENGAGKSTLMKILSGVYTPDSGEILLDGKPIKIANPAAARDLGINLIYQELSVAPHMTVAQNVFMGSEPRGRFGTVDERAMNRRTSEMLRNLGARFSATTLAKNLSIAEQQQVEIGRALIHEGRILIMDEPTAALSDRETEQLFRIIEQLRDKGIAILYISHRMAEVHRLATRVTILRDGGYVGELSKDELEPRRVVQMMVGRELGDFYAHAKRTGRGPRIAAHRKSRRRQGQTGELQSLRRRGDWPCRPRWCRPNGTRTTDLWGGCEKRR